MPQSVERTQVNGILPKDIAFPAPTESIFSKALFIGWYDGPTSGVVKQLSDSKSFKLDILAWGPGQERRIFALSPLAKSDFEMVIDLLSRTGEPNWPRWFPRWPQDLNELNSLSSELDGILSRVGNPELVIETDSMFETASSLKRLAGPILELLPAKFDDHPSGDFDNWHHHLEPPQ